MTGTTLAEFPLGYSRAGLDGCESGNGHSFLVIVPSVVEVGGNQVQCTHLLHRSQPFPLPPHPPLCQGPAID